MNGNERNWNNLEAPTKDVGIDRIRSLPKVSQLGSQRINPLTAQNIAVNGANLVLAWPTAFWDNGPFSGVSNTKLYIPVAGKYFIHCSVWIDTNNLNAYGINEIDLFINKNGAATESNFIMNDVAGQFPRTPTFPSQIFAERILVVGDEIQIAVGVSSAAAPGGTTVPVPGTATAISYLTIHRTLL
jgi:hypothetical protein